MQRESMPVEVAAPFTIAPVIVLGMAVLAILALHAPTLASMVAIWARSDTYAHGMIVAPIALWLVWRERVRLAGFAPEPTRAPLVGALLCGAAWLAADLANVVVVSQFALVSALVFSIWAMLGHRLARELMFPLGFLYFAVPFGDFMLPKMMDWTADFTVSALRLSGIPVYREGLSFIIPSGSWSVVEACSGVRYLIASLMVGVLYAYLTYRTRWKRGLFVVVAVIVPLFANWVRAYLIVLLGHVSDNAIATGADHLLYGWVFFGIVVLTLFWVGAKWREDEPDTHPAPTAMRLPPGRGRAVVMTAVAAVAASGVWQPLAYALARANHVEGVARLQPTEGDGWRMGRMPVADWQPFFREPDLRLTQGYVRDARSIGLDLGLWVNQDKARKLVTAENRLLRSGDTNWISVSSGREPIELAGQRFEVHAERLQSGQRTLLVWRWYWVNGHMTASDLDAKLSEAQDKLRLRGDVGAYVVLSTLASDNADDDARQLAEFAKSRLPDLLGQLPGSRPEAAGGGRG